MEGTSVKAVVVVSVPSTVKFASSCSSDYVAFTFPKGDIEAVYVPLRLPRVLCLMLIATIFYVFSEVVG